MYLAAKTTYHINIYMVILAVILTLRFGKYKHFENYQIIMRATNTH